MWEKGGKLAPLEGTQSHPLHSDSIPILQETISEFQSRRDLGSSEEILP